MTNYGCSHNIILIEKFATTDKFSLRCMSYFRVLRRENNRNRQNFLFFNKNFSMGKDNIIDCWIYPKYNFIIYIYHRIIIHDELSDQSFSHMKQRPNLSNNISAHTIH